MLVFWISGATKLFFLKNHWGSRLKMHLQEKQYHSRRYYCHMEECTCCLFLMEPFPSTAILVIVSSCNLFIELPFGPSNFPTKLNFGCSLTGTTTRTLRRIGFSWYMSTILVSLPGGFPPRWILAISKMRKNENQY